MVLGHQVEKHPAIKYVSRVGHEIKIYLYIIYWFIIIIIIIILGVSNHTSWGTIIQRFFSELCL